MEGGAPRFAIQFGGHESGHEMDGERSWRERPSVNGHSFHGETVAYWRQRGSAFCLEVEVDSGGEDTDEGEWDASMMALCKFKQDNKNRALLMLLPGMLS